MRKVEYALVVGVGVYGRHQATLERELLVQDLGQRRKAVGRTRSVGDDVVRGGVVALVVDPVAQREVHVAGRRRDHYLAGARLEVGGCLVAGGEQAGRFDDHVHAQVAPGELRRVALGQDIDGLAVDRDAGVAGFDLSRKASVYAVVLEQVGQGCRVGEVVDRNDFVVFLFQPRTEHVTTDATETVNCYPGCHCNPPG